MSMSATRIGAVIGKELAEFRRNRFIVVTACVLPIVFLITPTIGILNTKASVLSTELQKRIDAGLFLPLLIPVFVPALLAAYAVVGEREQETLETVLTTPINRAELLLGKAAAIFMPAVGISYLMFGVFVAITQFGAAAPVATAVLHAPQLPAELVFIPLLAGWAIWAGLAISARATDTRVAQQLATLVSLPPVAVAALMSFHVISPTFTTAAALAGALVVIDSLACFAVARLFDRERLITGTKPASSTGQKSYRVRGAA
jgi:ABC-type transport system involved in multi-copper enzyme maturation permease subunit